MSSQSVTAVLNSVIDGSSAVIPMQLAPDPHTLVTAPFEQNEMGVLIGMTGDVRPVLAKNLFSKHYQRWRRYGRVERVYEVAQGKICKLCNEPVSAKGLCSKHHRKQLHMKTI